MDGRCAGSIVAEYEKNYNRDDFFEVDYVTKLPLEKVSKKEKVYFVDYSFKKDTVWILDKLINEMNCEVIWIDHHTSSLNLQNEKEYEWVNQIPGLRQDKISGAALTYMYLYNADFDNDIPYFIELISDYDCWINKYYPDTTRFKIGLETTDYDALDCIWILLRSEYFNKTDELLHRGQIIKGYIEKEHKSYRDTYAYETTINGIKCLAINRKSNSWIFGEKYNEYPIVMVYAFNGEKWSYSIFSSDENVDCSKIAESYSGGGGSKGAAGFSLDDMPFKKCVYNH